jgi:beta-N-acetylhexosaminidase
MNDPAAKPVENGAEKSGPAVDSASGPASGPAFGPAFGPIMLDVAGTRLDHDDVRRIRHRLTGGVILFARNYADRAQLTALTAAIHAERPGILIAVDHEGGKIQRFQSDGFTKLPAMRRLGQLADRDMELAAKAATAVGYVLAAELRACGVDLAFTPVLDLDYGVSEVIGERAFHADAKLVTQLAKSLNHGLALAGMGNCGKHFPGHGFVEADSHHATPIDQRSLAQILAADAAPYGWLGTSLTAVMPAHVVYPQVDPLPAGFSRKWLSLLRDELGFGGVIFSDDLSMEGASLAGTVLEGAHAALAAGCDMVLICNSPAKADQLLDGLTIGPDSALSAARLAALRPQGAGLTWQELQKSAQYGAALGLLRNLKLV